MGKALKRRLRDEEAFDLADLFRRNHQGMDPATLFISRTADLEFAEIGAAYLGDSRAANMKSHIAVWFGFEVVTNSKYLSV